MSEQNPFVEDLKYRQDSIRKQLDILRKTRAARGGVGEPLAVPLHLRGVAAGVIRLVTDEDLDPNHVENARERAERLRDEAESDLRRISEEERGTK